MEEDPNQKDEEVANQYWKKIKKDKNKQQELEEICSLKMMPLENYAEVNEAHT